MGRCRCLATLCAAVLLGDPGPEAQVRNGPAVERVVTLDAARLRRRLATGRLALAARGREPVRLVLEDERPGVLSAAVVRGRVEGEPGSWVRFVFHGDVVRGDVFSPTLGKVELRPGPGGTHRVRRVDRGRLPVCDGVLRSSGAGAVPGGVLSLDPAEVLPGTPPVAIDVMVVYTPSARALAGGVPAIEATIDAYVDYANQVYAGCGVGQELRLVHAAEVAYVESGNSITDLVRLKEPADGFMDGVHPLRDSVAADCVALIATSGSAGTAYLMDDVSPDFEDRAFSAIGHDVGGLVFAHELGHNMGCGHDNFAGAPPAAFCFSYGHHTPGDAWRTIMSNPPGEFVDAFSTPAKTFMGFPLGVDGAGCPTDAADNVRSLNATAAVVAGFRP